jgi:hypothetical protein
LLGLLPAFTLLALLAGRLLALLTPWLPILALGSAGFLIDTFFSH